MLLSDEDSILLATAKNNCHTARFHAMSIKRSPRKIPAMSTSLITPPARRVCSRGKFGSRARGGWNSRPCGPGEAPPRSHYEVQRLSDGQRARLHVYHTGAGAGAAASERARVPGLGCVDDMTQPHN